MKNQERWQPSKYVRSANTWAASRDIAEVAPQSRLVADILAQAYAEAIASCASGDLLDHGCGKAPLYGMYADLVQSVITIDWANSPHETAHADVLTDLNHEMPFASGSFDTIVSSDVVEHLWNPLQVMSDFSRLVRPGGAVVLGTPFNYWMHEVPHDYLRWSPYFVEKASEQFGFRVERTIFCGGAREVLIDTLLKGVGSKPRPGLIGMIDRLARGTGFVSLDRNGRSNQTLGTVSVLRRM